MSSLAIEVLIVVTTVLALLLLARPIVIKFYGAKQAYQLWLTIPLCVFVSLLPTEAKITLPIQSSDFYVIATQSDAIGASSTQYSLLFWLYATGVFVGVIALMFAAVKAYRHRKVLQLTAYKSSTTPPEVEVYLNEKIDSPMLLGLFKPAIHLPANFETRYSVYQQQTIIKHEMFHYQRKDILWNVFANLLLVVFWFNPLSWLGYMAFRQDQELSCDEAVMCDESPANRKEYAKAVLASSVSSETFAMTMSFGKKGNMKMIKERIDNIKKGGSYSSVFTCAVFLCATLLAVTQLQAESFTPIGEQQVAPPGFNPVVKINPKYPAQAKRDGIEGYVVVTFGVTSNGTVEDIRVIDAHPENVFEQSTKKAVAQWRFIPNDNGKSIHTKTIKFEL